MLYTPDGQGLVTGGGDNRDALQLRDPSTGELLKVLRSDHLGAVNTLASTSDGRYLIAGLSSEIADVWDLPARQRVGFFAGHVGYIWAVACHPNDQIVATSGDDKVIRLWRIGETDCQQQFIGHSQSIRALAFSSDGQYLISGSMDGTTRIWRLNGTVMKILVAQRPYEGIDITGTTGLSDAQRDALRTLGAR